MNKALFPIFILFSLMLMSCSELAGDNTGANTIDNSPTKKIGGLTAINLGDTKYALKGIVDNSGNSGHNFHLRFNLPEGENITFHFFSSRSLSNGANFSFSRESGTVKCKITLNKRSHEFELESFENIEVIDLDIDIHNDHTDTHMLVWDHFGSHDDYEECSFDGGCIYNTEDFSFDEWLGVGKASGTFWGFSGNKNLILLLEGPLKALSDV